MELTELAHARLVVTVVVLVGIAFWTGGALGARRQQRRFAALAQSFGKQVIREGKFLSRFPAEIGDRVFDVRYQHIGKGVGAGGWTPGWYLVTEVGLQGVSELHSADIRARSRRPRQPDLSAADFDRYFSVRDFGYPLRDGWLSDRMRRAICDFYSLDLPLEPLVLEEALLIHRSHLPLRRFNGSILRELLARQAAVAAALERAL